MRIVDINGMEEYSIGWDAQYYKLSRKVGLKVTTKASRESVWLQCLNDLIPGLFPKFIEEVVVEPGQRKGYLMEHINGHHMREDDGNELLDSLLAHFGIMWDDNHGMNILVTRRGQLRAIDPDPGRFIVTKELLDKLPFHVKLLVRTI